MGPTPYCMHALATQTCGEHGTNTPFLATSQTFTADRRMANARWATLANTVGFNAFQRWPMRVAQRWGNANACQ
jgi:hypothetical protein